jgi:hypothetical protein
MHKKLKRSKNLHEKDLKNYFSIDMTNKRSQMIKEALKNGRVCTA